MHTHLIGYFNAAGFPSHFFPVISHEHPLVQAGQWVGLFQPMGFETTYRSSNA
jgi:hypothetical protein